VSSMSEPNRRILVVDDNRDIHEDFRKLLGERPASAEALDAMAAELFDLPDARPELPKFELSFASQGAEGFEMITNGASAGLPYALVFMDMRMPPGWDGLETLERVWTVDPCIQAVICTAYSDYSWEQIQARLGPTDRLLVLKKPFDSLEVRQLALAMTEKWNEHRERERSEARLRELLRDLEARREAPPPAAEAAPIRGEAPGDPRVPVVPIRRRLIAAPLVGELDPARAQRVAAALVSEVLSRGADVLVLDGSCLVPRGSEDVWAALLMAVQAVGAAGCRVVLSGMPFPRVEADPVHGPFWEERIDAAVERAVELSSQPGPREPAA
jgi:CheY-like chemotaxis protein